jgi:hypothetical protein
MSDSLEQHAPRNHPNRVSIIAWAVAAILIVTMIALPQVVEDMMDWGYAAMVGLGLGVVTAAIVAIFYSGIARLQARMYGEQKWLAQWQYSEGEWQEFLQAERQRRQKANWQVYRLIGGITVVVIAVLTLMVQDLLMVAIGVGLMAILLVPALVTPYTQTHKMTRELVVRIGREALSIGGWFRPFTGNMIRLRKVALKKAASSHQLVIDLAAPTLTGNQSESFVIPIPHRHLESAEKVAERLSAASSR